MMKLSVSRENLTFIGDEFISGHVEVEWTDLSWQFSSYDNFTVFEITGTCNWSNCEGGFEFIVPTAFGKLYYCTENLDTPHAVSK